MPIRHLYNALRHRIRPLGEEFSSPNYWERRYRTGGTSGSGSRSKLAEYKAEFINDFVLRNEIETLTELGCGDGVQLGLFKVDCYKGLDIAPSAIEMCEEMYSSDASKSFSQYFPGIGQHLDGDRSRIRLYRSDAAISLDVLYHLVEDDLFEDHLRDLFGLGRRFVIIYACDREASELPPVGQHLKWRRFTPFINDAFPEWELIQQAANPYPAEQCGTELGSYAGFFVYQRKPCCDSFLLKGK